VLSQRALNRALLERQLLLRRSELSTVDAIGHLVGMQAQAPQAPYVGLWSRLSGFRPEELSDLINGRQVVRVVLMRSTIHLVGAADCLALRPLVQPVIDRSLNGNWGRLLTGLDNEALAAAGRELVESEPRTFKALGELLAQRWSDRDPDALAVAIRALVPLVQVPPRGIWGASGQSRHTSVEAWLGAPIGPAAPVGDVILRYLAAFGPATVADVQTWSGLGGLREVLDGLRPRLRTFADERGRELFDLPDAPLPDPDTPAPARFLPEYDNALLSHADRARIIAPEHRASVFTKGALLVDGFVRGTWKLARSRDSAKLLVAPFARLSKEDSSAVVEEGGRLLDVAARGADTREIQFAAAG
jgi:hypothetical protein